MTKDIIREGLKTILSEVLNIKKDKDFDNLSIDTCDQWDSMAMVNIVLNVEKVFKIRVSSDELSVFTSYHNICSLLIKHFSND